jgi:hypothetical protein
MGPINLVVKGIGATIGLASEAIADRKEKKAAAQERAVSPNPQRAVSPNPRARSTSPYPPEKSKSNEDGSDSSDDDLDNDQAEWALDDAAAELAPPAYSEELKDVPPRPVDDLVQSFNLRHNTGLRTQTKPIPMPVILPQRRPKGTTHPYLFSKLLTWETRQKAWIYSCLRPNPWGMLRHR